MTLDEPQQAVELKVEPSIRINLIDDCHEQWPGVLAQIDLTGAQRALILLDCGALSARQNVLAAFVGKDVVGHVAFHVLPAEHGDGKIVVEDGRTIVEARLNSLGVTPGLSGSALNTLRKLLVNAARERAEQLRVERFVGFDPAT